MEKDTDDPWHFQRATLLGRQDYYQANVIRVDNYCQEVLATNAQKMCPFHRRCNKVPHKPGGQCLARGMEEGLEAFQSLCGNLLGSAGHTVKAQLLRHGALWLCSLTDFMK